MEIPDDIVDDVRRRVARAEGNCVASRGCSPSNGTAATSSPSSPPQRRPCTGLASRLIAAGIRHCATDPERTTDGKELEK